MFSYYNLVVSNAQAERSQLAGYRVSPGAKMEVTSDAISREIGHSRTSRFSRPTYRLALLLAAAAALAIVGIQGASAQSQPGLFADADGIEPPDMGVAHSRKAPSSVAAAGSVTCPEVATLLIDVDGIEPPDMGVAYALPVRSKVASADKVPASKDAGLTADADGIEPPDMGVAYDTSAAFVAFAKRQQQNRVTDVVFDADGIEPPDMGVAYDTSAAYRAYAERQQRMNRIAAGDGNEG